MNIDFRLAIPSLTAWCGVLLLLNGDHPRDMLANWAATIAGICCIGGFLFIRRVPVAALSLWALGAVSFSLFLQLPFHHETPLWLDAQEPEGLPGWASHLRNIFVHSSSELPGVGAQLIPGLAVGDTSLLSVSLHDAMKSVSLTHITAVSGANCIIVTAGVSIIAGYCGAGRRVRILSGIAALALFVVIVTPQPSVIRAAVMAVIVLVTMYLGRPGSGAAVLSTAVIVLLLWNPWWALEFGFILSVLAVSGLMFLSRPLSRGLSRWMPTILAEMISIPLAAQLMCQPVIILLTPAMPLYGLLANLVATPAAPVATVVGLVSFLFLPITPWLSHLLMWVAWIPAQWIGSTAEFFSALPGANVPWLSGPLGLVLAAAVSVLVVCALVATKPLIRRMCSLLLGLGALGGLGSWGISLIPHSGMPTMWNVAVCDVGQGDALILRSEGEIAVIDVGRKPAFLETCMSRLGISHIDLLVLTHFDKDHVGGLSAVIGKVDLVITGAPENTEDEGLLRDLDSHGARLERGFAGLSGTLGAAQWNILWPQHGRQDMQVGNPGSVTMSVNFPGFSSVFLGDLDEDAQRALLQSTTLGHHDVVKVAHHGSADQFAGLYERLSPSVSVLSVGAENDYGHPRTETMDLLARIASSVPRTDQDGLILISPAQDGVSVWTEH